MIDSLQLIIFILTLTLLYVPYCRGHAYMILDRLSRKPNQLVTEDYHGLWHQAFGHFRLVLHVAIGFALYFLFDDVWLAVKFSIIGLTYALLIYDSLIEYFRGRPISPFLGTCDGGWDFDCF